MLLSQLQRAYSGPTSKINIGLLYVDQPRTVICWRLAFSIEWRQEHLKRMVSGESKQVGDPHTLDVLASDPANIFV